MFRSAFLSEYSIQSEDSISRILKSHLLSNSEIILPAAAMRHEDVASTINENLAALSGGVLRLAHGNDCIDLLGYADKYPDIKWGVQSLETFQTLQSAQQVSVYDVRDTFTRFNSILRQCAGGDSPVASGLFDNDGFNGAILTAEDINLFSYFELVDRHISCSSKKARMNAYLKYVYNLCGALSTKSGNTFSIENAKQFSYISANHQSVSEIDSGLSLLISCALDVTDGLEDFVFLNEFDAADLDKLTFEEILEMRGTWLHGSIIKSYESIVQECVNALGCAQSKDLEGAFSHIDCAFELRAEVANRIKAHITSEVVAYKLHRVSRFLMDTSIQLVSFLSGLSLVKSIFETVMGATTEVAVLANREVALKKLIEDKTDKFSRGKETAELRMRSKSPTVEYLRMISKRLSN